MPIRKDLLLILIITATSIGCRENFDPPVIQQGLSALVVDGFLNNSTDTTFIRLRRTKKISEGISNSQEKGARLVIEDTAGNTLYNFQEINDSGTYVLPGMNLDINNRYRLRIITANGKQYLSDPVPVIKTPAIDSISWEKNDQGVTIHANTHDPQNQTHYYRWEYTETWNYHAEYFSILKFENGDLKDRQPEEYIYNCWHTQQSTALLLTSSTKLSEDIIYHFPIRQFEPNSIELSVKYFIALRQYGLTREAYEYMANLKKITDQTGSIFDAQPSEVTGNIHALNNSGEPVLGFITASTEETKQRYITNDEVAPWYHYEYCPSRKISMDSIYDVLTKQVVLPINLEGFGPSAKVVISDAFCVDCRLRGGTTVKPDFWQ